MNKTFLLTGSNMGNTLQMLQHAADLIGQEVGNILQSSSVYKTAAWGKTDQPAFLNQVLLVATHLEPAALLETILTIEKKMGREIMEKMGPRTIDIDILFYNQLVLQQENLIIPHPHIGARMFVLTPLGEIAPGFIHPVSGKSINTMLKECTDTLPVAKLDEQPALPGL